MVYGTCNLKVRALSGVGTVEQTYLMMWYPEMTQVAPSGVRGYQLEKEAMVRGGCFDEG